MKQTLAASAFLFSTYSGTTTPAQADEISLQYLSYDENNDRVYSDSYSLGYSKDISVNDTVKFNYISDTLSGGTPTWTDANSGGTPKTVGAVKAPGQPTPIQEKYQLINFEDHRDFGSVLFTHRFEDRDEVEIGVSLSNESDFLSIGPSINYSTHFDNANTTLSFGVAYLKNRITPSYLPNTVDDSPGIPALYIDTPTKSVEEFDYYNFEMGISQVLSPVSTVNVSVFSIKEQGYLNNPYLRVVREYDVLGGRTSNYIFEEARPQRRLAFGFAGTFIREFLGQYALHAGYRYYQDDWEITSHTYDLKLYAEITDDLTLIPAFRYYMQSSAYFYGDSFPEKYPTVLNAGPTQEFASSDYRLSEFFSKEFSMGADYKINDKLTVNIQASTYRQSTGLRAVYMTTGLTYSY